MATPELSDDNISYADHSSTGTRTVFSTPVDSPMLWRGDDGAKDANRDGEAEGIPSTPADPPCRDNGAKDPDHSNKTEIIPPTPIDPPMPGRWDHGAKDADRGRMARDIPPTASSSRRSAGHQQYTNAGQPEGEQGGIEDTEALRCRCTMGGRALVVCFDGTSNQFGENNTNVIELYHRIVKDENQLTYYNSGIGTYAKPSWSFFAYWKQAVLNIVDTAIAWNFEKIVLGGYRWLSANYRKDDRIYLFGFSRGAYQARVLAAMIHKVGLILPGNEEQIPFAYELYADHGSDLYRDGNNNKSLAAHFKETFSRKDVQVHYLGLWDTVSSVGVTRSKSLPLTDKCEHFCYMRHALALDERRVKFLPEYARGGNAEPTGKKRFPPYVKEVWFAGSHSDIGGGAKSNREFNLAAIPGWWMGDESRKAGLKLHPARASWDWTTIKESRSTVPSFVWNILEALPVKHLTYEDSDKTTRWPHKLSPRIIKPGQKIHASVAFVDSENYHPQGEFWKGAPKTWDDIIGKGSRKGPEWAHALGDLLELDLLDHSDIPKIMTQLNERDSHTRAELLDRLAIMASDEGGDRAITSDSKFDILFNLLIGKNDANVKIATSNVLAALARQGSTFDHEPATRAVFLLIGESDTKLRNAGLKALSSFRLHSIAIPLEILTKIRELVADGKREDRLSAAMALCSCIHKLEPLPGTTLDQNISNLVDILVEYLKGDDIEEKLSGVRGLVNLICEESPRKAIAQKPQVINTLASMLDDDDPVVCKAGLQGILAFSQSDALRVPIRSTPVLKLLSKVLESSRLVMQQSAFLALNNLMRDDGIVNDVTKSGLLQQVKRLLESEPRLHTSCLRFLRALSEHPPAHTAIIDGGFIQQLMGIMRSGDLIARCHVKEAFIQMLAHDQLRKHAIDRGLIHVLAHILTEPERYSLGSWSPAAHDSFPPRSTTSTHENAPQGQHSMDGDSFGNISDGRFDVRNGSFGDVSGGVFIVSDGRFGDISGGTFIVFGGKFGNVFGGNFIVYGGEFGDVMGGNFVVSKGSFGDIHGGKFLTTPGGGKFGRVTEGEFNSPEHITLNDMSGSLRTTSVAKFTAAYTHFNGLKELVERLAEFNESRVQLIRAGIIPALVRLVGFAGVTAFRNILKHENILAATLDADAVSVIVTSMLDKELVDLDDYKSKIKVLFILAGRDAESQGRVQRTIDSHLPAIKQSASREIIHELEQLSEKINKTIKPAPDIRFPSRKAKFKDKRSRDAKVGGRSVQTP